MGRATDTWNTVNADLVAGRASRLGRLGVVAATVELAVLVEVDEVHQELLAHLHQQHEFKGSV
jgi:hypothetical protein